ncbi:MAG TPA: CHAP domain-containing protein [Mesorhizobium sp.]|uniref:CHAP domain-containing protein n=1 Tax=Mesorhizobium sp. TaxID=1871066 RepID=UPI002DDDAC7E|nr:CHAP domain-containing protein [Mesorhizobium sp.]HEV2505450.1 CHAP domain-containing protein [Mesorhizobium sp.]
MAITRRSFVVSGSLLASSMFYGGLAGTANAATKIDELDFAFDAPVQWPVGEAIPTLEQYERQLDPITGPQNPFKSERIRAAELLVEMDKFAQGGKTPYQIARHFHDWRQGSVASDNETDRKDRKYFTREWPVRGNPLIMGLFDSTGLRTPVGDTTFWCAAFVSNCIHRSLVSRGNNQKLWPYSEGAASAAYRGFGKSVDDPKQGDIVVFQNNGEAWRGHVGFVHAIEGSTIRVLGGNQGAQNEYNGGEVNISPFNRNSTRLRLHSFRRHDILS